MRNNFDIEYIERSMGGDTPINARLNILERKQDEENKNAYVFTMSDEVVDRHGTIVKLDKVALKSYNDNPVVLWMHEKSKGMFDSTSYDPDNVLGYGYAYFEDGKLKNRITFEPKELNEKADKIKRKIDFGSIRGGSIGFIPYSGSYGDVERGEDEDVYYIREWELLEYSIVTIPSNPNALNETKTININTDEPWDLIPEKKETTADEAQNKETIISKMPRKERARKLLKLRKWQLRF